MVRLVRKMLAELETGHLVEFALSEEKKGIT